MRKLVQSDKAIKILSDPCKSSHVREAIRIEKKIRKEVMRQVEV